MKRVFTIVLCILFLSGCSGGVKIEANESTFLIGFRNECDCEPKITPSERLPESNRFLPNGAIADIAVLRCWQVFRWRRLWP